MFGFLDRQLLTFLPDTCVLNLFHRLVLSAPLYTYPYQLWHGFVPIAYPPKSQHNVNLAIAVAYLVLKVGPNKYFDPLS